eukprot:707973-Pyramimonas_sp.AAC.1
MDSKACQSPAGGPWAWDERGGEGVAMACHGALLGTADWLVFVASSSGVEQTLTKGMDAVGVKQDHCGGEV